MSCALHAGGDLMQGYLFARPNAVLPEVDFEMISGALMAKAAPRRAGTTSTMPAVSGGSLWSGRDDLALTLCNDVRAPLAGLESVARRLRESRGLTLADPAELAIDVQRHMIQIEALVEAVVELIGGRARRSPDGSASHPYEDVGVEPRADGAAATSIALGPDVASCTS